MRREVRYHLRRATEGDESVKVLIVYYSTYGHVYRMATLVAEGVKEVPNALPVVRTVPELIPKSVIDARADMKAAKEMQQDVPLVTMDDFREAGAIAFGTGIPCSLRFAGGCLGGRLHRGPPKYPAVWPPL